MTDRDLISLLDRKIGEARVELAESLSSQMFGPTTTAKMPTNDLTVEGLTKAMTEARNRYPKVQEFVVSPDQYRVLSASMNSTARYQSEQPLYRANSTYMGIPIRVEPQKKVGWLPITSEILRDNYTSTLTDNIFRGSPLLDHLNKKKEPMSIVKDIRAGINLGKETKRVKAALRRFEGSWLYKLKRGAHIGFSVRFEDSDKRYDYAALYDGKRWHLTGARSPQAISTDDLVDWLIEKNVKFGSVKLFKAV
jgi:hypothetical protein